MTDEEIPGIQMEIKRNEKQILEKKIVVKLQRIQVTIQTNKFRST